MEIVAGVTFRIMKKRRTGNAFAATIDGTRRG